METQDNLCKLPVALFSNQHKIPKNSGITQNLPDWLPHTLGPWQKKLVIRALGVTTHRSHRTSYAVTCLVNG